MTQQVSFFIPVDYQNNKSILSSISEKVDNYFYLGGRRAKVLGISKDGREKVVLSDGKASWFSSALKVISYATIVIPLILLAVKYALRSTHQFKVIDPKQKLEKRMDIPEEIKNKLSALTTDLVYQHDHDEIEWLSDNRLNGSFRLKQIPQYTFKKACHEDFYKDSKMSDPFEAMVKAKEICMFHQLDHLYIPHAKSITLGDYRVGRFRYIVIENLDFHRDERTQEKLYQASHDKLTQTARQLTTFFAKTEFNRVCLRHIPILNETLNLQDQKRVALIDISEMNSIYRARIGRKDIAIIGDGDHIPGLIECVSELQIDTVIAEALKQGMITKKQARIAKERRLKELHFYQNIQGKELIQVDLDSLGLELSEESKKDVTLYIIENGEAKKIKQKVTLGTVVKSVINELNTLIQDSNSKKTVKEQRRLFLSTSTGELQPFRELGQPRAFIINENDEKQRWLDRIFRALEEKGYIFSLEEVQPNGYLVQA